MKNNKGFTLIELIVVIVVLGILAVTAAPKFIGVQDEAQAAVADGIVGAMKSAMSMTHAKALISGDTAQNDDITVDNIGTVEMVYGYPEASADGIAKTIDIPTGWTPANTTNSTNTYTLTKSGCVVTYTQATDTAEASAAKVCS